MHHTFSGNPFDRAEAERRDPKWLADIAGRKGTRILPLYKLNVLVRRNSAPALGWVGAELWDRLPPGVPPPVLLGMLDGVAHFAVDVSNVDDTASLGLPDGFKFEDARAAATDLSAPEGGMIAQARSQVDWHNRHKFCSVCGERTAPQRGGLQRTCSACKAEHFPRTDPVVIMLVHKGDRCVLGQTRVRMSSGFYSCLAGFMDQGEAIEESVRREVKEESGLELADVRYHSSQPWPFPSSLMIGCHARAATETIKFDAEEMSDVRWYSRSEVAAALRNENQSLKVPGPVAIAHHLIKAWVEGTGPA